MDVQVCSIHQLDDSVLFVCVMLLDRYCATSEDRSLVSIGRDGHIMFPHTAVFERIIWNLVGLIVRSWPFSALP